MARRTWDREETLIALNVYCHTPFGRLHARNPEIIRISQSLGRTPSALAMKCCNLAAFDPALQARGISGLRKASQLDQQIWQEFDVNPESVSFEAEQALASVTRRELQLSETVEWEDIRGLDIEVITKVRVNQSFFRAMILAGYRSQCAVCKMPIESLLVASHIVPWSVDRSQRMNPRNGICLCMLHDKSFDRGLLIIGEDFVIGMHEKVTAVESVPSVQHAFMVYAGKQVALPDRWHPDPELIRRHNQLHRRSIS